MTSSSVRRRYCRLNTAASGALTATAANEGSASITPCPRIGNSKRLPSAADSGSGPHVSANLPLAGLERKTPDARRARRIASRPLTPSSHTANPPFPAPELNPITHWPWPLRLRSARSPFIYLPRFTADATALAAPAPRGRSTPSYSPFHPLRTPCHTSSNCFCSLSRRAANCSALRYCRATSK